MHCSRYCYVLALVLIISAHGMGVGELLLQNNALHADSQFFCFVIVARVHFSQPSYVVMEHQNNICVDVINDMAPTNRSFIVSYSFSECLISAACSKLLKHFYL